MQKDVLRSADLEQLTAQQRWRQLLRFIFRDWLKNQSPDPVFLPLPMLDNCRI